MMQTCPCCKKELRPPADSGEGDMGNLFSCNHCQSVLKWDNESLQVIYESKTEPSSIVVDENQISSLEKKEEDILSEMGAKEEIVNESEVIQVDMSPEESQKEAQIGVGLEESQKEAQIGVGPEESQKEAQIGIGPEEPQQELPPEDVQAEGEGAKEVQEESLENLSTAFSDNNFSDEEAIHTDPSGQDFSDVEQYGNAQASSEKGFLRYDLSISGLDSNEIERQVLGALEDPRFNWDANEVLRSQRDGVLVIKNLNPIKAMCLVSDLSFLSVEISWKQYMALNIEAHGEIESSDEQE